MTIMYGKKFLRQELQAIAVTTMEIMYVNVAYFIISACILVTRLWLDPETLKQIDYICGFGGITLLVLRLRLTKKAHN